MPLRDFTPQNDDNGQKIGRPAKRWAEVHSRSFQKDGQELETEAGATAKANAAEDAAVATAALDATTKADAAEAAAVTAAALDATTKADAAEAAAITAAALDATAKTANAVFRVGDLGVGSIPVAYSANEVEDLGIYADNLALKSAAQSFTGIQTFASGLTSAGPVVIPDATAANHAATLGQVRGGRKLLWASGYESPPRRIAINSNGGVAFSINECGSALYEIVTWGRVNGSANYNLCARMTFSVTRSYGGNLIWFIWEAKSTASTFHVRTVTAGSGTTASPFLGHIHTRSTSANNLMRRMEVYQLGTAWGTHANLAGPSINWDFAESMFTLTVEPEDHPAALDGTLSANVTFSAPQTIA